MDIKSNYTTQRITLRISHNSLSMAAINRDSESQIDFEPYILKSGISMAANLREAFRESTLLSRGYTHATVLLDSPFILVPVEEFHEEDKEILFNHSVSGHSQDLVVSTVLPDENAVALYGINKDLKLVLDDHFPDLRLRPLMYSLWSRMHQSSFGTQYHKLFGYFHDGKLEVFAFDKNRFRYCNSFGDVELHDAVYFLLYVWNQLAFDARRDELHLSGRMPEPEQTTAILRRYVQKVYVHSASAAFNRAPITRIKGIQLDMITHFVKR